MYAILIAVALLIVLPIAWAALSGFRDNGQLFEAPLGLPDPWRPGNYIDIITSGSFWQQVYNSVVIGLLTTALTVFLGAMAAFIFARFSFRGREVVFTVFTLGLLFPVAVAILPLYLMIRQLGLLSNLWGVIIPQVAFGLPITILILRGFFRNVPAELEDAASIDGCSPIGFFWRVLLPISRPALATVGVLAIVGSWNAFFLPLIVLFEPDTWTLPIGVTQFSSQYSTDTARILAYLTLSMIPALVFYIFAERQLTGGLTAGSVKG